MIELLFSGGNCNIIYCMKNSHREKNIKLIEKYYRMNRKIWEQELIMMNIKQK